MMPKGQQGGAARKGKGKGGWGSALSRGDQCFRSPLDSPGQVADLWNANWMSLPGKHHTLLVKGKVREKNNEQNSTKQ